MRRALGVVAFTGILTTLAVAPARAQQPTVTFVPSEPIINSWYIGANTGAAVVEKFSAAVGVDGGIRVWRNLDLIGELAWVQNAVTRRQLDRMDVLADSLEQTQGQPATGDMEVPTLYAGLGARWVFEQTGKYKPYVLFTVGAANTELKPTLTLAGADITDSAGDYGLTLGEDVIGTYNDVATSGGIGIVMGIGTWYVDAGARLISISGQDQRTNIARIVIGGGYRF